MIVYTSLLEKIRFSGMTIFPFIFIKKSLKNKEIEILLNHEKIHLRQQLEGFIIFFYILYGISFLIQFIKLRDFYKAYRENIFEREAYTKQEDMSYFKTRPFYAWRKF